MYHHRSGIEYILPALQYVELRFGKLLLFLSYVLCPSVRLSVCPSQYKKNWNSNHFAATLLFQKSFHFSSKMTSHNLSHDYFSLPCAFTIVIV